MNRKRVWYQQFQVIGYVVGGLAALGTVIVVSNRYIELPQKVEAAETKNTQQDRQIDRLITLQEYYQQQSVQQQTRPQAVWKERNDRTGEEWCTDGQETWSINRQGECE